MVADVCNRDYLLQILQNEADIYQGMNGRWTPHKPNPWTVTPHFSGVHAEPVHYAGAHRSLNSWFRIAPGASEPSGWGH